MSIRVRQLRLRRRERGMTIAEVLASLAILAVCILGLTAALITSANSNQFAAKRTQSNIFATARIDRISGQTQQTLQHCFRNNPVTYFGTVDCSAMNSASDFQTDATQSFLNAAPGTAGWMLDILDSAVGAKAGDDLLSGPAAAFADSSALDTAATLTLRTNLNNEWTAGGRLGCGSPLITGNPAALCREIHIEQISATVTASGLPSAYATITLPNLYHVWIRVVRGGPNWRNGVLTLDKVLSPQ
jgi:Tfp pilus assembly protein PilV